MDEKNSRGQPLKLRAGVREKILAALAKGATYNVACGYAGIHPGTLRHWLRKGKPLAFLHEEQLENHPDLVYYEMYLDVKRVEYYAAIKWLEKIDEASSVHWQAAAWKLERRYPKEYGRFEKQIKKESGNNEIEKARSEVKQLKGDDHGRSALTKG